MSKQAQTTIIENIRPSIVELPGEVDKEGIEQIKGQKLDPGQNDVTVKEWSRVKNHKSVKMLIACGILVEKGSGKAKKLSDGLDSLEKHEVILQIAKCDSIKILKDWMEKTESDSNRQKCKSKIDELVQSQGKKE